MPPGQIRENLATEFPEEYEYGFFLNYLILARFTGSKRQVKYLANKAIGLPPGEVFAKMYASGEGFLQQMSVFSHGVPELQMILYNSDGIMALKRHGSIVFMDGTHSVFSNPKTTLTTLVVKVQSSSGHSEGFICAWFVHTRKTSSDYVMFLREMQRATSNEWVPSHFVVDFEIAERTAVQAVFPTSFISLCYFHLKQSVQRHLQQSGLSFEMCQIIHTQVKLLQESESRELFNTHVLTAEKLLRPHAPVFWEYFSSNYITPGCRFPSELWALYVSHNFDDRTNNFIESRNKVIKERIGTHLSETKFVKKAKQFATNQTKLIEIELNISLSRIPPTPTHTPTRPRKVPPTLTPTPTPTPTTPKSTPLSFSRFPIR